MLVGMPEPSVALALPPWWLDEALAAEGDAVDAPPLEGEVRADVAIVGGGYTGLWTALAVNEAEPSAHVVVLEAEVVGWGPSGRNGGFLYGFWPHLDSLRAAFGLEGALGSVPPGRADRAVSARVLRGARRRRLVPPGRLPEGVGRARAGRVGGQGRRRGSRARRARGGSAARRGRGRRALPLAAVSQGRLLPRRLDRPAGPARACAPARRARRRRRAARADADDRASRQPPSMLETPGGRVVADEVVVATNAALTGWRPVSSRLTNFGSYVVLTEPVPELLEEIGWGKRVLPRVEPEIHRQELPKPPVRRIPLPLRSAPVTGILPSLELLDPAEKPTGKQYTNEELEKLSREVELRLLDFGIEVQVVAVHPGPVVTRFEMQLAAGVKVSRISALAKDLAQLFLQLVFVSWRLSRVNQWLV